MPKKIRCQIMSNAAKKEYLYGIRFRYQIASGAKKKRIVDEFCLTCGYNRKYAIRTLNQKSLPKIIGRRQNVVLKENMTILKLLKL